MRPSELRYFRQGHAYARKPRARWRWYVRATLRGTTFSDRYLMVLYGDNALERLLTTWTGRSITAPGAVTAHVRERPGL